MPDLIEGEIPDDVLCDVCGFCGMALYKRECAAEFDGRWIDYEGRCTDQASFAICGECRLRVKSVLEMIATRDIEPAVARRNQIDDERGLL